MNNLPASQSEDMMAYIKPRKKSTAAKIVFLFAVVTIVAAICITAFRGTSGKFHDFLNGIFKGGEETSQSTPSTPPAQSEGTTNIYEFDPALVPEGAHGVIPADLSADMQGKLIDNKTELEISTAQGGLAKAADGKIRVLLINTHPYESYAPDEISSYGEDFSATGGEDGVKTLAQDIVLRLLSLGIGAEYLDTGVTSGKNSYADAYTVINEYLSKHPDILYVIDIHRGALLDSSGNMLRPITVKDDELYAQMKFSVGASCNGWENTLASVNTLFSQIYGDFKTLLMPTEISASRLNQHLPATVFTLDVGTCGNIYEEAERTARYFARIFAEAVK